MTPINKKALLSLAFIALFLIIAAAVHLIFKREKNVVNTNAPTAQVVTLEGTYDCLPHKVDAPVDGRVCDYGLITTIGDMYALDFNMLQDAKTKVKAGDRIKATGLFTPIETLSSDYITRRYVVKGIFSVKSSFEVLTNKDTTSNGVISFEKSEDFGLALNTEQITVTSYIPPCDDNLDYCLYYSGKEFVNTNFGSAGIRIKNRKDISEVNKCLMTPPTGYEVFKPTRTATTTAYSLSVFNIGDAGAGHYANGELYRLAYKGTCHEFETRISATQFANYPEGTKEEFKDTVLKAKIKSILNGIELVGGEELVW